MQCRLGSTDAPLPLTLGEVAFAKQMTERVIVGNGQEVNCAEHKRDHPGVCPFRNYRTTEPAPHPCLPLTREVSAQRADGGREK